MHAAAPYDYNSPAEQLDLLKEIARRSKKVTIVDYVSACNELMHAPTILTCRTAKHTVAAIFHVIPESDRLHSYYCYWKYKLCEDLNSLELTIGATRGDECSSMAIAKELEKLRSSLLWMATSADVVY